MFKHLHVVFIWLFKHSLPKRYAPEALTSESKRGIEMETIEQLDLLSRTHPQLSFYFSLGRLHVESARFY